MISSKGMDKKEAITVCQQCILDETHMERFKVYYMSQQFPKNSRDYANAYVPTVLLRSNSAKNLVIPFSWYIFNAVVNVGSG